MEALIAENIQNWVAAALKDVRDSGLTNDIHIDGLIEVKYQDLSKKEVLNYSLSIFKEVSDYLTAQKMDTSTLGIFMNIDLISESETFLGKPKNVVDIINQIDTYTPPEIVIYKEVSNLPQLSEFYRVPLFYKALTFNEHIQAVYKEYRPLNDVLADKSYTRELNFIFVS